MYLIQDEILSNCGIRPVESVLVAFSGGADSLALLLEMERLLSEGKIHSLAAAHLNHMIRGESADEDASFCCAFCSEHGIPYYEDRIDIVGFAKKEHLSLETAARIQRYRFLERVRIEYGYTLIALGHHKNDQAETVLLHLIRGAGTDGIAGMRYRNGTLIRPLLDSSKEEILAFLNEKKQKYRLDESNGDLTIERNRIRCCLIPSLKEINPNIVDALARTARYAAADADYLNRQAENVFKTLKNRYSIASLDSSIRYRVLKCYLPYTDMESADIQCLDALLTAQAGTVRNLKYGFRAWVDTEEIHVDKPEEETLYSAFAPGQTVVLKGRRIITELIDLAEVPCPSNEAYIDLDKTTGELIMRLPAEGDRFTPIGLNGSKLLSDYFTDRKIPRFKRNYPVITDSIGIIAVLGNTIDERVKITEHTKKILHIIIEEVRSELG